MKALVKFVKDERGLEVVEWAVMAGLIVVGIVGVVVLIGERVNTVFNNLLEAMGPEGG